MEEVGIIFRALLKNWLKLTIMPVLAAGLVFYLTKDQPKKYVTEAKLIMNFPDNKAISLGDMEMKQYQILTYFQNVAELVKSEKTINKVRLMAIEKALSDSGFFKIGNEALLAHRDLVVDRLRQLQQEHYKLDHANPVDTIMESYLDYHKLTHARLSGQISASRIRDSNFLYFYMEGENAQKTYTLAKLIIKALIEENKRIAKSQIQSHRNLIERLVEEAKIDLNAKIKRLEKYKIENNIINLDEYTKAIVTYLVDLEAQRGAQLATIAASKQGKNEIINTTNDGNELSVDLTANQEIIELKEKLKTLTRERMLATLDSNRFKSKANIEGAIEDTRSEINNKLLELTKNVAYDPTRIQLELANRYLSYDLDEAVSQAIVRALDEEIARAKSYVGRFASMESTIGTIEQEISTARNVYLQLLNKLSITQSLEYGSGENVIEVVDPPRLPEKPQASKRILLVGISGIAVFILFAGGIVILHLLDASVVSVKKFEKVSNLKVVSAIPALVPPKKDSLYAQTVQMVHKQQVIHLSKIIEQKIKTDENVVLFLSSQMNAKSHELANSIKKIVSSENRKIAIVDADWTLDEKKDGFEDICDLLEDGKTPLNESKILEHIDNLKKNHDLVVVVAAPTNLIADYRFWVEHYRNVVYIYRTGPIWTKVDARFEKFLLNSPINMIGAVLNNIDVDQMEDFIGNVPKKRTLLRVLGKRVLSRDF